MSRKKNLPVTESPSESLVSFRSFRELLESLAIALVLALLFKAFAAEAYVIPTGSMATTLMGRHKDVHCSQCGFPFQISASEETSDLRPLVIAGTCPQCRYTMYVGADNPERMTHLSYNGDRIFVNKGCFNFRKPSRWNVTVFRYPAEPQMNYIKRLVGMENETLRVQNGDIFVKKDDESEFTIQRKPFAALQAMLRPVDDNDYVQPKLHELGWPTRWFSDEESPWTDFDKRRSFRSPKSDAQATWLTFRHIVPSSTDWFYLSQNKMPPHGVVGPPQLITDFVGYNSGINSNYSREMFISREIPSEAGVRKDVFCYKPAVDMGLNWVGDLAVSCSLIVEDSSGTVFLKLVKGGVEFLCSIRVADGKATLSIPDVPEFQGVTADTPIRPGRTFNVFFCNIDEELRLAVNGKEIDFSGAGRYDRFVDDQTGPLARTRPPTELDLTPASVGIRGAVAEFRHLKILRDLYYIASEHQIQSNCDLKFLPFFGAQELEEDRINRLLSTPTNWKNFGKTRSVEFKLGKDQYLMFGDNSACSKDSRLWASDGIPSHVGSEFLLGEAIFVYWPHGHRIPGTRLALLPNFAKMRRIH